MCAYICVCLFFKGLKFGLGRLGYVDEKAKNLNCWALKLTKCAAGV